MTTGERMKLRRKEIHATAEYIAEQIGVSAATVYRYEKGDIEKVPGELLVPIAKALRTTPAYLMGWEESEGQSSDIPGARPIKTRKIPLLGSVACGEPIFASQDFGVYVEVGTDLKADFALKAKGDSMIGARILDGDIVFIRSQEMVDDGEIAAVMVGDDVTLKRVYYDREANVISLFAENPVYKPMRYNGAELDRIRILGKAIAFQSDVR